MEASQFRMRSERRRTSLASARHSQQKKTEPDRIFACLLKRQRGGLTVTGFGCMSEPSSSLIFLEYVRGARMFQENMENWVSRFHGIALR